MYRLNANTEMTIDRAVKYVEDFELATLPLLLKYERYDNWQHDILNRAFEDDTKPNNKIVHTYCNYISNTLTSYFMSNGVKYSADDESAVAELNKIFRYNDEQSHNYSLAKEASVFGVAYELVYVDIRGNVRFKKLKATECIPIYDNTLEDELLYLIRFYDSKDILEKEATRIIEIYSRESIARYKGKNNAFQFVDEQPHGFTEYVPVSIYKNNEKQKNDFGMIITLNDAYDMTVSDSVNDMAQFADSYLVLKGLGDVSDDDLRKMKINRTLLLDDESGADFLVKNVNDAYAQNILNRLDSDIHKFSGSLDLTSDITALSGIAIKYRLIAMENNAAAKQTEFKKGLLRRIELISQIISVLGGASVITEIEISFSRNLPTDEMEAAELVNKLRGIVSDETLLSLLPFVENAQDELEKIKKSDDIYKDVESDEKVIEKTD
jgi:SPP1 family phage portal protein